MNTHYDIVIVGGGPIGITTACTIKALNSEANICVVDKRNDTTRNHGLNIRGDAVRKIQDMLKEFPTGDNYQNHSRERLIEVFGAWSGQFIRTTKIESDLTELATQMGVTVLRGKGYEVTENNFDSLFESDGKEELPEAARKLHDIFKNACLVIGADGAHSTVRKIVMQDKLVNEEVLRHLVELKYQTEGNATPRGSFAASSAAIKHGNMDFESMNKAPSNAPKPVTLHVFVDESTYNALRVVEENGNLKGVFGNSWTLEELREKCVSDPDFSAQIKNLYAQLMLHTIQKGTKGFHCNEEKISTLIMNIYRSEDCVREYKGKYVLLVGDSESGIVLEGGFNKGLKGAAECAKAASMFVRYKSSVSANIPDEFVEYQQKIQQIFHAERNWAITKNRVLQKVETVVALSHSVNESSSSLSESSSDCVLL